MASRTERGQQALQQIEELAKQQSTAMRSLGQSAPGAIICVDLLPKKNPLAKMQTTLCTIVLAPPLGTAKNPDDILTYDIRVYKKDAAAAAPLSAGAAAAPPVDAVAAAAAAVDKLATPDTMRAFCWRPESTLSWGKFAPADALMCTTLTGLEWLDSRGTDRPMALTASGKTGFRKFEMACFYDALAKYLPAESLMMPNIRARPELAGAGIWLLYDPRCKATDVLAPRGRVDVDKAPYGVRAELQTCPIKPKWYDPPATLRPPDGKHVLSLEFLGTLMQWSDGSHILKRHSLHEDEDKFDEIVLLLSSKLWSNHLVPMFGIKNTHVWISCVSMWAPLMPMLLYGNIDTKQSDKVPMNKAEAISDGSFACGLPLKFSGVLADTDGFIRKCLPPVSLKFVEELCMSGKAGKPILQEGQYLVPDNDQRDYYFDVNGKVACLSLLTKASFDAAIKNEKRNRESLASDRKRFVALEKEKGADPTEVSEMRKRIAEEETDICTYRCMATNGHMFSRADLPVFAVMSEDAGTAWVKDLQAHGPEFFMLVIYAVKGIAIRDEPDFADKVEQVAEMLQLKSLHDYQLALAEHEADKKAAPPAKKQKGDPAAAAPAPPASRP